MDYRLRQQRPRAYNEPGHAHELTFSCYRRFPFLRKERTCQWLADSIADARERLNYAVWGYVFMPEHMHMIVYPIEKIYDDSDFLKAVKEPVSRKAVQFLKKNSPDWLTRIRVTRGRRVEHHIWQPGRGHDRKINQTTTLLAMLDYIHMNPVRRGLVERAVDWKWSSAGWFAGKPLNDLQPDRIPWNWWNKRSLSARALAGRPSHPRRMAGLESQIAKA